MLTQSQAATLADIGQRLGPDVLESCTDIFDGEQAELASRLSASTSDVAYGPDGRHRLDLYCPAEVQNAPVLLFVHGGGFVFGDKGDATRWMNANVGRMAAVAGMIGAVMNYRLAPTHRWPAGAEDVGLALDWLRSNIRDHGGNPDRIILVGTSAGAIHIAGHIKLRAGDPGAAGAVLLSGLYGFTDLDQRDQAYHDESVFDAIQSPKTAIVATDLPLLLACAQYDPPRFQTEFLSLLQARVDRHGTMPRAYVASAHNHYSLSMHLGTADRRLADEIIDFAMTCRR